MCERDEEATESERDRKNVIRVYLAFRGNIQGETCFPAEPLPLTHGSRLITSTFSLSPGAWKAAECLCSPECLLFHVAAELAISRLIACNRQTRRSSQQLCTRGVRTTYVSHEQSLDTVRAHLWRCEEIVFGGRSVDDCDRDSMFTK